MPSLFEASGLGKSYAAPVLTDVSLDLQAGEVHAVVGENGAGKSTLARIVAGVAQPDAGAMRLRGASYAPRDRAASRAAGFAFVMQEPNGIGTLTVAESLFLDRLPTRFGVGVIDRRRLRAEAGAALARVGLADLGPDRPVASLGIGQQQLVEIAAALARRCEVLILDEPTAALTPAEAGALFAQVERLRREGTGVLFISHRLAEVERVADRVSVLRDGRLVATRPVREIGRDEIVRLMVGRAIAEPPARADREPGEVALRVQGFTGPGFRDVSFEVRRGEVLGLAGLVGSGRTELLRAIYGADRRTAGSVFLGPSGTPASIGSPRDAVRRGLALVPEDRKTQGLLLPFSVRANVSLSRLRDAADAFGRLRGGRESALADPHIAAVGVRARSNDQPTALLSGGNQQKALLARWLCRDSDVLLVDEPTRGIDVGARSEAHALLRGLADRGKALVVASSELEELYDLADRILVLSAGRVAASFARGEWTADAVMAAAVSGLERVLTA
jgi:ribose transport system ATP-binding protein